MVDEIGKGCVDKGWELVSVLLKGVRGLLEKVGVELWFGIEFLVRYWKCTIEN